MTGNVRNSPPRGLVESVENGAAISRHRGSASRGHRDEAHVLRGERRADRPHQYFAKGHGLFPCARPHGREGLRKYWRLKNMKSLDGFATGFDPDAMNAND